MPHTIEDAAWEVVITASNAWIAAGEAFFKAVDDAGLNIHPAAPPSTDEDFPRLPEGP